MAVFGKVISLANAKALLIQSKPSHVVAASSSGGRGKMDQHDRPG